MAKQTQRRTSGTKQSNARKSGVNDPKVGSDRGAAEHFVGKGDFGIPAEGAGRFTEVAAEAKFQPGGDHLTDPRPPRSGGGSGNRESGVGGVNSGAGSSSGGDIDTDFVGVGTQGSGLSASGPDGRKAGPDMTDNGTPRHDPHPHQPAKRSRGSTVDRSGGDVTTTGDGMGSGGLEAADRGDDAAAGEISQGEAGGDDNTDTDNRS